MMKIINSEYETGFRGFVINITSFTEMYNEFVQRQNWLLFFATYRISQDHLEMLFGRIRTMNGSNDNPMAHALRSAFRKILHQCDITQSPYANVKALTNSNAVTLVSSNILTVPSTQKEVDVSHHVDEVTPSSPTDAPSVEADMENEITYWDLINNVNHLVDSKFDPGLLH